MANTTTSRNGNGLARSRDAHALARSFFGFDPFMAIQTGTARSGYMPAFEAMESEDCYIIKGDLPGVAESDLDISMHNNVLTVSGTRRSDSRYQDSTHFLRECHYGSFTRSFSLPDSANSDAVDARLDGGVLTLTVGKRVESLPRKIALSK